MQTGAPTVQYDWQLFKALFLGGMEIPDILDIPKYKGMNPATAHRRKNKEGWIGLREQARMEGTGQIARALVLQMQEAIAVHRQFMLDRLTHERYVLETKTANSSGGGKHQKERLENLRMIDDMGRRLLGMDKEAPVSREQKQMQIMIAMQGGAKPTAKVMITQGKNGDILVNESGGNERQVDVTLAHYEDPNRDAAAEAKEIIESLKNSDGAEPVTAPRPGFHVPKPPKFKMDDPTDQTLADIKTAAQEVFGPDTVVRDITAEVTQNISEGRLPLVNETGQPITQFETDQAEEDHAAENAGENVGDD